MNATFTENAAREIAHLIGDDMNENQQAYRFFEGGELSQLAAKFDVDNIQTIAPELENELGQIGFRACPSLDGGDAVIVRANSTAGQMASIFFDPSRTNCGLLARLMVVGKAAKLFPPRLGS